MSKFHQVSIGDIRQETEETVSIAINIPESEKNQFNFIQGQYITFKADINGEDIRRTYSICSSPLEQEIRVAIKKIEGGKFSTWANEVLKKGDTIEAMPPMGNFFTKVNPKQKKNYVAFAAGSGITPILSIIKTVLAVEPESTFTLVYGNKGASSIIFKEELEGLKNKYLSRLTLYHIFSREKTETEIFNGRIDAEKCDSLLKILIDTDSTDEFFICGPGDMIVSVTQELEKHGVDKSKIHFELFTSPTGTENNLNLGTKKVIKKEYEGDVSRVKIILDGIHTTFNLATDGDSILDAAHKAGADAPYACKGAVCCTCRAKVLEGKVEMSLNYSLTEEEVAQGYILTCQSHPVTEQVIIDFDQA